MTFLLKWWKPIAVLLTALGLFLGGMHYTGTRDEAKQAKSEVVQQKAITKRAKVRSHVEQQTAQLPDAGIQRIGDADPGTAAGKLRGWTRDEIQ